MINFHVGQKVVCVKNHWNGNVSGVSALPQTGVVYTIRALGYGLDMNSKRVLGLLLEEISGLPALNDFGEYGFVASRFRPVVERKTDISIFREILNSAPTKKERALVTSPLDRAITGK